LPIPAVRNSSLLIMQSWIKSTIAAIGLRLVRLYYRYVPLPLGKLFIWNTIVRPYLLWRHYECDATTRFGARMHVRIPETLQTYIYFFGIWEPEISAYITRLLSPGDTFIDIGANVGYDTLLAASRVGPQGHVYAFEASPGIYRLLQNNLNRNNPGNVSTYNIAICDQPRTVDVYLHPEGNLGGTTIIAGLAERRSAMLEGSVSGRPITAVLPETTILNARLIKIDVEGAEWQVIQGLAALLPRLSARTEILVEVNRDALRRHGTTTEAFVKIFRDAGFSVFTLDNPYAVDQYLRPVSASPEPLRDFAFEQYDLLFRRSP
jgi:FkbM family methyltransferase